MLKNKIIVKKIRNILILLMAIIIMLGAYHNIRNSRAENVIELTSMAIDNYGYLSDEEFKLEARELEDDLYEVELPESVNGKKINQIVEVTLDDMNEATTEEEIVEITDNKIYLSKEQIEQEKLNIEVEYDVVILETNEQGEYNKILLAGKTEEERAALEITEQTEMLYNKILKYEDAGNKKIVEVNGYMPIDAELQIEEVSSTKIKEIFGTAKIDVAYDIKVIHQVKSEIPEDEIKQSDEKTEIIETMEINPEDYGEIYEVSIKDINIKEKSQVFHVKENNEYEEVYIKENTKGNISFEARTFSIYGVSSDDELVATVSSSASCTSVEYKNLTKDGYDVYLYGLTYTGTLSYITFPTWTSANGQDDITWDAGENLGNGTWHYRVNASAHNNEEGQYYTDIYFADSNNDKILLGGVTPYVDRTAPNPGTLTASEYNTDSSTVTIYLNQPSDNHGIARVLINGWYGQKESDSPNFTYGAVSYDSTNDRYYATFNFNDIVNGQTGATNNGQGKYYFDAHVYDECENHVLIDRIKVVYGLDNTLMSTPNETSATSGFLGNTSLQRQDIEKVIFTDDTSNAIPIGVESQMIRSYDGYNNTGSGHASSTTSWYDFTGNQNGVITGGTFGDSYLQLDGVDDWVNLGKVNLTNQVTVDVVIELNSIGQDMTTIIGNTQFGGVALTVTYGYPGFWVYIANKGYVYARSDTRISSGKKVRLTGVYDGTRVSIFVDGVLQDEVQTTGNIQAPTGNTIMALGAEADENGGVNTGYVNMKVYGVKVHTKALTTTERGSNGLIRSYDGWGNNGTNHEDPLSTWNDFTYNCHATVNGGTWGGNWLGLDGVNDWVNLGQTSFSSQVTLDVIIAPLSIQSGEVSVLSNTQTGGAAIYLFDGKPRFYVYIKELGTYISITSSTALTSNTITRITGIYDGKKAYLYVNGSLVAQTAQTGTIGATTNSTVMAIGCEPTGSTPQGSYANMNVYSAKVYNKALEMNSPAKIRTGIMRSMQGHNNTGSGHSNSTTVWNDFSSNCDGVVMGATWGSDYLEFDGVDDWVGLGEVYFTEEATLDVTIELDEITSGNAWIMGNVQNGGLALNLEDGVPQFWVWTNSSGGYKIISATQALTIGKKTRIMGRYDGTKISLYVDGVLVAEDSLTGLIKAPEDDTIMVIGCNPYKNYGEREFLKMKVYAAKAYDRAITDSDIQQVWDVSAAGDYSILAWFGNTAAPYTIYIGSYGSIYANENSSYLFSYIGYGSNCTSTTTIENLNLLNTSKATNMSNMFKNCGYRAMTSLDLGDNFDTSNATDMTGMFDSCGYTAMESLNLGSKFNTSKVTNMLNMFAYCGYTKMTSLDLGNKFDTSKVTEMTCMFQECGAMAMTSLNLGPNFDTSSVTGMDFMFLNTGYKSMTSLDLGDKFDTNNVESMEMMFKECGGTSMTSLDLGPAFTKIANIDEEFMADCGKSGAVIYAPESIYKNRTSFKLSSGDTSTASGTIAVSTGRTIELKYRPEWTVETTTIDTANKAINIQLKGATNTSNYTSNVTTALTANDISVWIDGTKITGVSKTVTTANPATGSSITQTVTLTNFEESARQAGKSYKEWSGNITLKIEGRGEATSTYTKNVLVDSYGNQSMSEIDTTGTWTNIDFKDSTQSTANTAGKLFADFVSPEFTYEYSNTTINHNTKTVTVVFDITDKYFNNIDTTKLTANNITVTVGGTTATGASKTLTKVSDITGTVNGASTKIGEKYQLVITNLEQTDDDGIGDGNNYSGITTLAFPKDIATDKSGNKSIAKTITIGKDDPTTGDGHDSGVIVDVVDPIWKVENINIDKTNKKVTADLIATDKYLTGTSNSTLTTSNITLTVDGDTNANTAITKALSTATFSTNLTTGLKEIKYTLTLTNWEEASKQSGKSFLEYSGTTKIEIAAGVVTDQYTNTSKEQELTLGHVDFIKPRIEKVSSTKDASGKTETIVFNVIDKYLDTSDSVAATEITAYVDGETASLTKTLTRVTANDVSATINGTSQVVSQQYKLVLSNFEQSTNNAKGYKDWSGTVTIDIAANAVKDTVSGTTANTNDKTTIKGDYVDFVNPFITYETTSSDIDRSGKSYQMVFTVTDKYYTSGELSTSDLTITLEDGKNTYNLKNESGVTIGFAKTGDITASNVKMTNASTGAVETVSTATIGHRYVLTISNLEELEIKTGNTTLDYSGIITLGIAKDKIVDRTGNKNVAKTITSVASLEDGSTTSVVDVVQPIWRSTSGGSINWTAKTASVVVKGTDTYYASNSLTAAKINVYAYTGSTGTDITSTVNPQLSTATALNESVTVSGTTSTRQYGVQYTISLTNIPTDKGQIKIVIPAGTLTDSSGNTNEAYEIKLFTTLKSAASETAETSAFLGNSSLQRQNIESITFLDSTADANSTKWDVSEAGDNSIIAWYTGSGPYQVYIGSDTFMCANADSSYLFSYIGYASTCTATSVINGLDVLNTTNATNMSYMFNRTGYQKMTALNLGDNFDTSNVTNMGAMFSSCGFTAMTSLNLGSNFNTAKVTNMANMFDSCGQTLMSTLTLGSLFDTSSVTNMSYMFEQCGQSKLTSLNLGSKFNTSKVTNMNNMFSYCGYGEMSSLNLGSLFDTSLVTNMNRMFYNCGYTKMTTLTLGSKFNTVKVQNMKEMFYNCGNKLMTSLDLGDLFYTTVATDMTSMFNGCGTTVMTALDLGPAFTKIADTHDNFMTNCGASGAVIYAPESIYKDRTSFKLSSTDTSTASGTIAVSSGKTINAIYKPEWTRESTTLDTTNKTLSIVVKGSANKSQTVNGVTINYSSNVTSTLPTGTLTGDNAKKIAVYIDGELDGDTNKNGVLDSGETPSITRTVTKDTTNSTESEVYYTIKLSNLEETARQSGKNFKEWSGNIEIKIGGRGEATSTYSANILKDTYGNQNMMETDESGSWAKVSFKDGNLTSNTANKMFTDFIAPEFTYEYSNTTINHNTKTVTVVFDITDKYFNNIDTTKLTANNITVTVGGITATGASKTLTKVQNITATVNGTANTKIGEKYQLVITNLEQTDDDGIGDGYTYSGITTLAFPTDIATDKSGNKSIAKTITIGKDEPTTGDGHDSGVIVDVVDPVWEVVESNVDQTTKTSTITLRAKDKYFKQCTLTEDKITVYVNGVASTSVVKTLSTPTDIKETVDGVANTVVGKEYTLTLGNLESSSGGGYVEFTPIDSIVGGTAKYRNENGGSATIKIAAGTIEDQYTNLSNEQTFDLGNIDVTKPEVYGVQKTKDTTAKTETIIFNVTDKNYDSTDFVTTGEITVYVDNAQVTGISKSSLTSVEIKTTIDGETKIVGHQYTLVLSGFESGTLNSNGYKDWSGTVSIQIAENAAKDTNGNTLNTATTTISDFVDFLKPVIEKVSSTRNNSAKTETIVFTAIDKYMNTSDLITEGEIKVYVDGVEATTVDKALTSTEITKTFNKTVGGTVTSGTYTIGHTYTLVLSGFEETDAEFANSGRNYREWSGNVSIEVLAGAVKDKGPNGDDNNPNTNELTQITGDFVDFIKPRIEKVSSSKNTSGKTETIIFNVMDKYLDTSDPVAATEITVYVDEETASLTKSLSKVQDITATVNGSSQIVGQQYQLVLSNFEQSTNNAKGYKDYSGTVSISVAANAVKDKGPAGDSTSPNTNEATTVKGDYVDFVNPFITYETTSSDIDRSGKSYQMVFTVTDKYYTSGELSTSDLTITLEDGKNTYDLKSEPVTVSFVKKENVTASNVKMTNSSTGAVETVSTATIGHRYVLTISNLEELEIKTGNTTLDYSGIITLGIAKDNILDRTGNKNVAKTITSVASLEDGSTTSVVDVVQPIWRRTTGGTVDLTNKTASVVVKGTDTYYASNSLTAAKLKVYAYTGSTQTDITSTVSPQLSTATALNESVTVSGTTSTRQYGVQYTISLTNLPIDKSEVKIVIPASTLTDQSGNTNEAYEIIVYTTLKSAASETAETSAFLGNSSLQRQNIESITFKNTTTGAASNKWDVSDKGDNSIIAWYTGSGPYQVYIGSNEFMCANKDSSYLFSYIGYASTCTATSVINGLDILNTTTATNMSYMFNYCGHKAMTSLDLGDNFDTRNVTNMRDMFASCGYTAMTSFDLGDNFNTSNVTNMSRMFIYCGYTAMISLDLSSGTNATNTTQFNTSSVTDMSGMFNSCGKTAMASLNLGNNFDTSEVTDMNYMFFNCGRIAMTNLSLGAKFNTSKVTDMSSMFYGCGFTVMTSLNLGEKFDTSKVTNMNSMFKDCGRVAMTSLDLGNLFYTTAVTDMTDMFNGCGTTVMTALDLGPAFTKIADTHDNFMTNCGTSSLVVYAPESIYFDKATFKVNKIGE